MADNLSPAILRALDAIERATQGPSRDAHHADGALVDVRL